MVCASTFMILTVRFTTAIPRWISRGSVCAAIPAFWQACQSFQGTSLLLAAGRRSLTQFKSVLFGEMARRFNWKRKPSFSCRLRRPGAKLGKWFFDRPRDLPIVIASASPEFELQHAAKLLGVPTLIGTKCDVKTGRAHWQELQGRGKTAPHRAEYRPV